MDIVTLFYNNDLEIKLLKLQSMSFSYLDTNLINNIFIIYNDIGEFDLNLIINNYPILYRERVRLVNRQQCSAFIDIKSEPSSWLNQQLVKLFVSKIVKSEHYLMLDSKNHFIRNINYSDCFDSNGKPKIHLDTYTKKEGMIVRYFNCLDYFNVQSDLVFTTVTPFLFKTQYVLDMMNFISEKENTTFTKFFYKNKFKYTEFFLYSSYLIYSNKIVEYWTVKNRNKNFKSIMCNIESSWNACENTITPVSKNREVKVFGLHRIAIQKMNKEYKRKLNDFYKLFYNSEICEFIEKDLLFTPLDNLSI